MKICVAIPTFMRKEVLLNTIAQVLAQNPPADEVLVIDQTPEYDSVTEATLEELDNKEKIRWIKHSPPNTPGARNRALSETKCDIILYIDDDVNLPTDFVARHLKNYENPDVSAIAGRVLPEDLVISRKRRRPKSWPRFMDAAFFDYSSSERKENIADFLGANHSVRVDALKAIRGYDEDYNVEPRLREESDAAIRLWKTGYRIDFDPRAELIHLASPMGGARATVDRPRWQYPYTAMYFAFRHWYPSRWFWEYVCIRMFRSVVFNKPNLKRPWCLPWAITSYWYAVFLAYRKWQSSRNRTSETGSLGPG